MSQVFVKNNIKHEKRKLQKSKIFNIFKQKIASFKALYLPKLFCITDTKKNNKSNR